MRTALPLFAVLLHSLTAMGQWQPTNYAELMSVEDIHFLTEDLGHVVGYHEVYRTTDGGESWELVVENIFGNGPRLVHFINESVGFIAGSSSGGTHPIQVAKTINGGTSWTITELEGNQYTFSYGRDLYFIDDNTGFLVCNGGSVYRTTDQGVSWTRVLNDANEDFTSIHFPTPAVGFMIPTSGNEIYRTINGGNTWSTLPLGLTISMNAVFFTDEQTGFIAADNTRILRTTDGGLNWTLTDFGTSDRLSAITFTDASTGYAIGTNGTLLTTTNGGDTWVPQLSGVSDQLTCISFANANVGYIGTALIGRVLRTDNGGGILSIGDALRRPSLSVHPVPSDDVVHVSFAEKNLPSPYRLMDMRGAIVKQGVFAVKDNVLHLGGLPPGIYLLQLTDHPTENVRLVKE